MENKQLHVHFMGICGSGCASIALLAHAAGYRVSGCDQSSESYYGAMLKEKEIPIYIGHQKEHLTDDVDIVAVTPAIFDISPDNEELKEAERRGILMTWQEFMGRYLQEGKDVITVSGTHGKTTTTFLTGELLIDAGLDPTVEGGSVFKKWKSGGRPGKSYLFLCEADEFNRNFYHYQCGTAVINNVEMDHPECFRDLYDMKDAYVHFLSNSEKLHTLILNGDSEGAVDVLHTVEESGKLRSVRVVIFTKEPDGLSKMPDRYEIITYRSVLKNASGTVFEIVDEKGMPHRFSMHLFGEYNVMNAAAAVCTAWAYRVSDESIQKSLDSFSGVGRRFDQVGTCREIPVYDDYAHHPTEIASLLTMCREHFSDKKILAVFEPHQVSRLRLMFDEYVNALTIADQVVIMKTHIGREVHKDVRPITKEEWEGASSKIVVREEAEEIGKFVLSQIDNNCCDMIVVIGAASSYKISRYLVENL